MLENVGSISWFWSEVMWSNTKWEEPFLRMIFFFESKSLQEVKRLCPCEDGASRDDTELEHSFTLFLQPIWAVVWYRICCWQIYNWYTLCSCAALQATVPLPASVWFSLSAHPRELLNTFNLTAKYITQRNFNTCFKFNFLLSNNTNLSKDIKAWRVFMGVPVSFYCCYNNHCCCRRSCSFD